MKLRKASGKLVDLPEATIKRVLKSTGFTGNLLARALNSVLREAANLATQGVISITSLEKAIVRAIHETNKLAMDSAQKFTKRWLK